MVFTGIYVYLTHKLLKVNEANNKTNLDFYREQIRLSSIPLIAVSIPKQSNDFHVRLDIENTVNLPAYDLDIWICSMVDNSDYPKKELYQEGVGLINKEYLKRNINNLLVDGELYSLYDRGLYPVLQGNYRIKLGTTFKFLPTTILLVIQYKDHLGNNYYQEYIMEFTGSDYRKLIIAEIIPSSILPCKRFDLSAGPKLKKDENIPKELDNFYDLLKAGLWAPAFNSEDRVSVEHKWEFDKIKD